MFSLFFSYVQILCSKENIFFILAQIYIKIYYYIRFFHLEKIKFSEQPIFPTQLLNKINVKCIILFSKKTFVIKINILTFYITHVILSILKILLNKYIN